MHTRLVSRHTVSQEKEGYLPGFVEVSPAHFRPAVALADNETGLRKRGKVRQHSILRNADQPSQLARWNADGLRLTSNRDDCSRVD